MGNQMCSGLSIRKRVVMYTIKIKRQAMFEGLMELVVRGNADAQYILGTHYESGVMGRQNTTLAKLYYEMAHKNGHSTAHIKLASIKEKETDGGNGDGDRLVR